MKLRTREAGLLGLVVGLLCIISASLATAQGFAPPPWSPMQTLPPLVGPNEPTMSRGLFYVSAGVRFRNIKNFRFDSVAHEDQYVNPGTPPFGPDDVTVQQPPYGSLQFGTGTGRTGLQAYPLPPTGLPGGDPRTSGIWIYQNGQIDPRDPGNPFSVTCGSPTINCGNGGSSDWPDSNPVYSAEPLGRFIVIHAIDGTCCNGVSVPRNAGQFILNNPQGQANASTISGTTTVSFQLVIDGTYNATTGAASNEVASLIYRFNGGTFSGREFADRLWTPALEAGLQVSNYFDLFTGFSFYGTAHSTNNIYTTQAQLRRRAFTDSFPFASDDTSAWPITPFDSANLQVGSTSVHAYQVIVDGQSRGNFPTRTYFEVVDFGQPLENFQETISHSANINTYEWRFGARSWFPMWGLGRLGVTLGPLFNLINYNVDSARTVISLGPTLPAGTVTERIARSQNGNQVKFGGYAGADLEAFVGRLGFVKAAAEYSISGKLQYQLLSVQTEFNPGGFSSYFAAGLRF